MLPLDKNIWVKRYPLQILGTDHGRTVTVMRLKTNQLILHSMAPFSPQDITEIRALGEPTWLMEAMLLHDTYAREGRALFPDLPFLAPVGFTKVVKFPTQPLLPAPPEWTQEIEVIKVGGAPKFKEHVVIHKPSRTLIVADLLLNFPPKEPGWSGFAHRHFTGIKRYPGISVIFRQGISDAVAFRNSMNEILAADFDRIIVGHGRIAERHGKALLRRALADANL